MFGMMTEAEAWQQVRDEKISVAEYYKIKDSIAAQNKAQIEAEQAEKVALEIEQMIINYGGTKGGNSRKFGQIPNPFSPETGNLTNQMLLLNKAKQGNTEAIQLVKFLHQDAGLVCPDHVKAILNQREKQAGEVDRLLKQTQQYREANDTRLGRGQEWAFPELQGKGPIPWQGPPRK